MADGDLPLRTWHFAEGNSRREFGTFFSFLNLSDQPASVMAYYHREDGIRLVQWLGILPHARLSLRANDVVIDKSFGASFYADQDIVVERSTTWGPNQNAETVVGFAAEGKRTWSFAEGTTRGRVSTYFVTQSLSDSPANVTATFVKDDGKRTKRSFQVGARARDSFRVNDLLPDSAFGAIFVADQDVVVERTIMSEGPTGVLGGPGYTPTGSEVGYRTWSFAEGSTRRPYLTYFVMFNPSEEPANTQLRFSLEGGSNKTHRLRLPPLGRIAFDPRDVLPASDFATTITADRPIIAERSYYSTGDGLYGTPGYTTPQPRDGSRSWYFAEGNTTGRIETYFLVLNLTDQPTKVQATYYTGQKPRERVFEVPASGRIGLRANDIVPNATFAARFIADQNVLVERTFYFPGWSGFTALGSGVGRP
jgi:hypothetical protein